MSNRNRRLFAGNGACGKAPPYAGRLSCGRAQFQPKQAHFPAATSKAESLLAKRELWGFHSSLFVCGLDGSLPIVELAAAAAAIVVAATIAASAASAIAPAAAAKQNED